jgi:transposase InsO family protein
VAWAAQQARNLAMDLGDCLGTLRFLIHERDPVFTASFGEVFRAERLRIIRTLPKTPRMNAICERVNGTLRRELLDRILRPCTPVVAAQLRVPVIRRCGCCGGGRRTPVASFGITPGYVPASG